MTRNVSVKLTKPPANGVHGWLFAQASKLARFGVPASDARRTLRELVIDFPPRPDRNVPEREINGAVDGAYRRSKVPPAIFGALTYDASTGWPECICTPSRGQDYILDLRRAHDVAGGFGLVDLFHASPVQYDDDLQHTREILGQLYGPHELICVGKSTISFETGSTDEFDALHKYQLIVPNPMRAFAGRTVDGTRWSAHTRHNTGPRRFLVVESDAGLNEDIQAGVLWHLAQSTDAPLVLATRSGGKSVHGWFRCDGVCPELLARWFRYASSLGADPRLWLPEQFVRMPDGTRDNGNRQTVVYFNPEGCP